ncbi:MAG: FAD-binding oxidoreductase [Acidobacteriota bacterium]|nr:FAD-binding oxidoreductase [Acidobacteriota bacterium]
MLTKTNQDEIQDFLTDASNLAGGEAERVVFPESREEISEILREASRTKTPVTVSGAGTGIVGGRVPFGGVVLALDKLNQIKEIVEWMKGGGYGIVQPAVSLDEYQKAAASRGLFYPPDPTEWSCQMGGTVATNASGARSFKYGATRGFIERLEIVLPTGETVHLRRGEIFADKNNRLRVPVSACGEVLIVKLPTYRMPDTRKHASGYFYKPGMDAIDLFIGSEGTLGVVTEIETRLLPKPEAVLSGIVFFQNETDLLNFVVEAREISFATRKSSDAEKRGIDASLLEYFDRNALDFIRAKFPLVPENMDGAIFFEQEVTAETEDDLLQQWFDLLEKHNVETETSWFATNETDLKNMRDFRHALPVAVNEWIVRHRQRKVSTDMAVPDREFAGQLKFYQETLWKSGLNYVIFGHIGDNHVHVNILPRNAEEAVRAKHIYGRFVARTCIIGGTISAEHGIGKLKRQYLEVMFGERYLNEMAAIKRAFDPAGILNRGVMFDEKFLN